MKFLWKTTETTLMPLHDLPWSVRFAIGGQTRTYTLMLETNAKGSTPPSWTVEMNHSLRDDHAAPTEKVEMSALDLYRRTGRLT
jgi:hypothetical protein